MRKPSFILASYADGFLSLKQTKTPNNFSFGAWCGKQDLNRMIRIFYFCSSTGGTIWAYLASSSGVLV